MFRELNVKYKLLKQKLISINWNDSWKNEESYLNYLIVNRKRYPENPIYDSLFQFKAQIFKVSKRDLLLLNIVSFFGFLYLALKFSLRNQNFSSKYDVAYFYSLNIFEKSLYKDKKMVFIDGTKGILTLTDLFFLLKLIVTFRGNFILLSTVTFRLAQIKYAIKAFGVAEIWTNMEYSSASGVLKYFCNQNDVKLFNFMHGEKILTLRDAFSSFNSFYVWDEHYIHLFSKLHTNADLKVSNPWKNLIVNRENIKKGSICYILKGLETKDEITKLKYLFDNLIKSGYKVFVKDHPRQQKVSKEFTNIEIIKNCDILDCFEEYEIIVAQFSTVLIQCSYLNIPSYIDDYSNEKLYNNLLERGYLQRNKTIKDILSII